MLVLLNYDRNVNLQRVMEALLKTLLFTSSRQTGKYSIETFIDLEFV